MNEANVKLAIKIMEQVRDRNLGFDLDFFNDVDWQSDISSTNEFEEAAQCGTTCCFSGWLALHPEVIKQKGFYRDRRCGALVFYNANHFGGLEESAGDTMAIFLGISKAAGKAFVYNHPFAGRANFYLKPYNEDVRPQDVIDKLNDVLKGKIK